VTDEIVYLCGPIGGCTDDEAVNWRDVVKARIGAENCLDPMRRDYRGREDEAVSEIVERDKEDIEDSDVVLANCWQPSPGTSMEILYAWEHGIPVYAILPPGARVSPWYRYHARVFHALEDAINEHLGEK
jgi:nucleoside 2-deoxyribosyltransferase